MSKKSEKNEPEKRTPIRETISDITADLITELREMELQPMEKIALLKALLPYSVGKLPTAAINYSVCSGQPTSARIIELSKTGGKTDESLWLK